MKQIFQIIPKWVWITGLIILLSIAGWNLAFPTNSFRYKVTVNVETPEGLKSGSAVREFVVTQQPELPHSGPIQTLRGEAVVVDLGKRGVLFSPIGADDEFLVFKTFPVELAMRPSGMRYYERLKAKAEMTIINYPLLVAFKDIKTPATVTLAYRPIIAEVREDTGLKQKVIDVEDHLPELFGEGVKLKSIEIEMTDEDVTWGIERYLPWLINMKTALDGSRYVTSNKIENMIGAGSFQRGKNE